MSDELQMKARGAKKGTSVAWLVTLFWYDAQSFDSQEPLEPPPWD